MCIFQPYFKTTPLMWYNNLYHVIPWLQWRCSGICERWHVWYQCPQLRHTSIATWPLIQLSHKGKYKYCRGCHQYCSYHASLFMLLSSIPFSYFRCSHILITNISISSMSLQCTKWLYIRNKPDKDHTFQVPVVHWLCSFCKSTLNKYTFLYF